MNDNISQANVSHETPHETPGVAAEDLSKSNLDNLIAHAMNGAPLAQEPVADFNHNTTNVVSLPTTKVDAITMLQEFIDEIKKGHVAAIAVAVVTDGGVGTEWVHIKEGHYHELHSGVVILQHRIALDKVVVPS